MLSSLLYVVLHAVFRLVPAGDHRDREVEILVLRHQVKVLTRKAGRPELRRRDRLLLAADIDAARQLRSAEFQAQPRNDYPAVHFLSLPCLRRST
jgi:hypothetical protein